MLTSSLTTYLTMFVVKRDLLTRISDTQSIMGPQVNFYSTPSITSTGASGYNQSLKSVSGQRSSLLTKHLIMVANTATHTTTRLAAMEHPNILNPGLSKAVASCSVAVTRAVLGNTNDHQVIWKGSRCPGMRYFHKDPTDTRKNQKLRPQSHKPIRTDRARTMKTACCSSSHVAGTTYSES